MWAQEGAQLSQDLREVFKNELLKQKAPELESGGEILAPIPPSVAIVSSVPPPRGGYKKIPGATRLTFNQECHKRGKAAERYDKFKVAKTVDEYKKLNPEKEQQKDLEHAIVNKLVKIDTIDLGDEHESALTWINKFIEKSSTTKEKKPTKKTKAVTNDDEVQKAERILSVFEEANTGLVMVDGKLIEKPVLRQMQRTVEISNKLKST